MSIKKETWFNLLAAWLILMAAWSVFIKFLFPIVYAVNYGHDFLNYIMWDFWWVAHLWLAWSFLNISHKTYYIGLLICFLELIIILYKLYNFFESPNWSIWDTSWMINKIFVLGLFLFITLIILKNKYYILNLNKK